MSNVRGAPLFLRASVVRSLIQGVEEIRKGVVQVPVLPVDLVDRPRRSEDPRLAKANDNIESGRVAPPVASGLVAVEGEEPAPLDWPDAPLPDHADPDLDRPALDPAEEVLAAATAPKGYDAPLIEQPLRNLARRKRDSLYFQNSQADARELEEPVDAKAARMALLREAAARAEQRQIKVVAARPSLGVVRQCRPVAPVLPTEVRRKRLDAAIAFLKRQAILVSPNDRTALVRKYRVSGKQESKFAEEVIQIAVDLGMEMPA